MPSQKDPNKTSDSPAKPVSLWFLFFIFLKIGCIAFGGFTALIAVVENDIIRKRKLMKTEDMLDGISLAMLLPGPVAVNVVAFVGYRLRRGIGAFVSATGVILPSFFLLIGLSHIYFTYGELPAISKVFSGFIPAVTAIIITTAWGMSKKAVTDWPQFIMALAAASILLGIGGFYITLTIILAAGAAGLMLYGSGEPKDRDVPARVSPADRDPAGSGPGFSKLSAVISTALLVIFLLLFSIPVPGLGNDSLARIFVTFSGMSLMLFGGGFVFIPLIQEIVVEGMRWVTQSEFTSAIALGQVTPGPILISAAFIGYKVKGLAGGALATFAIFFPSALLMVNASRILDRIKRSRSMQAALQGIRAAVVGMVFAAAVVIGKGAQFHWVSLVIFAGCMVALMRFKLDIVWIIPSAGILGMLLY
ncbi:MAG: chromate efflux transporter [Desulfobacterales bacterium]|nr:chromate efflux transporter [Desulfobacterales bacterium]